MKLAAVNAIAELARMEASEVVARAYGGDAPVFGPDYIIPKPFDPRLILQVAPAVARAAMDTGVAQRADRRFRRLPLGTGAFRVPLRPAHAPGLRGRAQARARVVYTEGEDERVLRAVQTVVDEGLAEPVLLGRRDEIARRVREMGLRMRLDDQVQVLDPARDRAMFDPLVAPYQAPGGAARRAAGRGRAPRAVTPDRGRRRCCCRPGRWMPRCAAAAGGWYRQMEYLLPIIPKSPR